MPLALLSCSVFPPRGFPPFEEREVLVYYDFEPGSAAPVVVPASRPGIAVHSLWTSPRYLRESHTEDRRCLHPIGERLVIRCRYRVDQQTGPDGALEPLPTPEQLFPGASSLRTLWRRDDATEYHEIGGGSVGNGGSGNGGNGGDVGILTKSCTHSDPRRPGVIGSSG